MSELCLGSGVSSVLKNPPLPTDISLNEAIPASAYVALQTSASIPDKSVKAQSGPIIKSTSV